MSCDCDTGIGNTGFHSCIGDVMADATGVIVVPRVNNDGDINAITIATDTLDATFFQDKYNQSDASKRWLPILGLEEVSETFDEAVTKDYSSGTSVFLQDGPHKWTSLIVKKSYSIIKSFKSMRCVDAGVYIIDSEGKMSGVVSDDGTKLLPYPTQKETIQANPSPAVAGSNPQEIVFAFQFGNNIKMENTGIVLADDTAGFDILTSQGLLNVNGIVTSPTALSFTVELVLTNYGNYEKGTAKGIGAFGWVDTDFKLVDNTGSPVTITTVTPQAAPNDNIYDVVIPSTPSNVLTLNNAVTGGVFVKKGFQLSDATITTP